MSAFQKTMKRLYPYHVRIMQDIPSNILVKWCGENAIHDFDFCYEEAQGLRITVLCFDSKESQVLAILRWV